MIDPFKSEPDEEFLKSFAKWVDWFGRNYNGFESKGTENIPKTGPALIVFYHALNPLDAWYFGMNYYLKTGRLIRGLGDKCLFKIPGFNKIVKAVGAVQGDRKAALNLLKEGHLVGVAPGGIREAISGTKNNYKLVWKNHVGFARVALEAGVDIIPAFTQNVEEMYRAPFVEHSFFQNIFEKTKLPLVPIVGLGMLPFPVKLRTWIGKPIKAEVGETAESLAEKTRLALQKLIDDHQVAKQSVGDALLSRLLGKA